MSWVYSECMSVAVVDTPRFRAALNEPVPALALREVAMRTLHDDLDGDTAALLEVLQRVRMHFRRVGRPEVEDIVLEVMDFVSGWSRPDLAF